jgi:hypothetical protein
MGKRGMGRKSGRRSSALGGLVNTRTIAILALILVVIVIIVLFVV